jgi:PhnB protein
MAARSKKKVVAKKAPARKAAAKKPAARKAAAPLKVKAIPDGYPRLMTMAVLRRCGEAIEFYKSVFGAKERMRMPTPDGKVAHCELQFGDSVLMLADETMEFGAIPPRLCLYVERCDDVWNKALAAGGQSRREPKDQFYGDRSATFVDPFGAEWTVMTHVEDVSPEEMERRAAAYDPSQAA